MTQFGMNMLLWTDDCTGDKFLPLFGRLKQMGFDSVEIPIFGTEVARYAKLGQDLAALGLGRTAVTALSPDKNLIGADPAQRAAGVAHLKAALDCAQALGSKLLVGPIYAALGVFSGQGPTAEEWAWGVDGLKQAAAYAQTKGITLVAEYLNRFEIYLLNSAVDCKRMVKDVDHPNFRMMYDTFHANIEEKNITEAVKHCSDVMMHVHISENDRSTPGLGGVNWAETWKALKAVNFKGQLVIEAFGQGLPALAAATKIWRKMFKDEETLAREGLAFMKKSWGAAAKPKAAAKAKPVSKVKAKKGKKK
ncbi:MAG TPA: sugar phosphate isomerase/epimerase [Planctomycetota bacterium]